MGLAGPGAAGAEAGPRLPPSLFRPLPAFQRPQSPRCPGTTPSPPQGRRSAAARREAQGRPRHARAEEGAAAATMSARPSQKRGARQTKRGGGAGGAGAQADPVDPRGISGALHRPALTWKSFGSGDGGAAGGGAGTRGASYPAGLTRPRYTLSASAAQGAIFRKCRVWSAPKIPTEKSPVLRAEGHMVCEVSLSCLGPHQVEAGLKFVLLLPQSPNSLGLQIIEAKSFEDSMRRQSSSKKPLPGNELADILILDFLACRTVRFLIFKPLNLWYFVVSAQAS
ncbi:uncharacterized protein ACOB7L_011211 [Callospermophilus lateralis]